MTSGDSQAKQEYRDGEHFGYRHIRPLESTAKNGARVGVLESNRPELSRPSLAPKSS
jgi:hypothetical protein